MNKVVNITLLIFVLAMFCEQEALAQKKKQKHQSQKTEEKRYLQMDVLDSLGEISFYNKFTPALSGDSLRLFPNGEKWQGWKEDFYKNGNLLHKGFYKDGQLELFKNFWENGKIERVMAVIDSTHSNLEVYYDSGNQRRQVVYYKAKIKRLSVFYPNNLLKQTEEYDEGTGMLLKKKTWFANGQIASELVLQDLKSKKYKLTSYHSNGKLAETGIQYPSKKGEGFVRSGNWTIQDSTGKKKTKTFGPAK